MMAFIYNLPRYFTSAQNLEELKSNQRILLIDEYSKEYLVTDVIRLISDFLSPIYEMDWIPNNSLENHQCEQSKTTLGNSGIRLWAMEIPNICLLNLYPRPIFRFWIGNKYSLKAPFVMDFCLAEVTYSEYGNFIFSFNADRDVWPQQTAGFNYSKECSTKSILLTFYIDESRNFIFLVFTNHAYHRIGTPFYCKLPTNWKDLHFFYQNDGDCRTRKITNAIPCFSEFT